MRQMEGINTERRDDGDDDGKGDGNGYGEGEGNGDAVIANSF